VPSPQTRKVIEASPLDPAANLAGALRAPSDRRSLGVVSWPEISKQFQKFALILRRTFPRPVPRGVYDHSPTPRSPRQRIAQKARAADRDRNAHAPRGRRAPSSVALGGRSRSPRNLFVARRHSDIGVHVRCREPWRPPPARARALFSSIRRARAASRGQSASPMKVAITPVRRWELRLHLLPLRRLGVPFVTTLHGRAGQPAHE